MIYVYHNGIQMSGKVPSPGSHQTSVFLARSGKHPDEELFVTGLIHHLQSLQEMSLFRPADDEGFRRGPEMYLLQFRTFCCIFGKIAGGSDLQTL